MKKRKKRNQNSRSDKRFSRFRWVVALVVVLGLVMLWQMRDREANRSAVTVPSQPIVSLVPAWYGDAEHQLATRFADEISKHLHPAAPENVYMPPRLKAVIGWMMAEKQARRLNLECTKWMTNSRGEQVPISTLMGPKYETDGTMSVAIVGPKLYKPIAENGGRIPAITQELKNWFAVALAHEVIHLENKEFLQKQYHKREEVTQEELRAYMLTSKEVVRPLRDIGQPVGNDFIKADDAARNCGYTLPCQALLDYYLSTL